MAWLIDRSLLVGVGGGFRSLVSWLGRRSSNGDMGVDCWTRLGGFGFRRKGERERERKRGGWGGINGFVKRYKARRMMITMST